MTYITLITDKDIGIEGYNIYIGQTIPKEEGDFQFLLKRSFTVIEELSQVQFLL